MTTKSKNQNCLEGVVCPRCHQEDRFNITGEATWKVRDDGTYDRIDGVEWDSDSPCVCPECGFSGTLGDFELDACFTCGEPVFLDDDGVSHHWSAVDEQTSDYVDHEADADHVALPEAGVLF